MRMRVIPLLAVAVLVSGSFQAWSQTKNHWGEGNAPCSEWTKERSAKTVVGTQLAAWLRGYVSGANVMQNYKVNIFTATTADMDAMDRWINDYCRAHPLDKLVVAADSLVKKLIAQ